MIGNSLLTQIIVAAIAIGIVITYIKPQLDEIKSRQDEISQTREEVKKVADVNARLAELYAQLSAIPQRDKAALTAYLPDMVDEVQVLKDISLMAEDAGVELQQVSFSSEQSLAAVEGEQGLHEWSFSLTMESSYEELKQILAYLERNHYPLVISSMNISPVLGGNLNTAMVINAYSLKGKEE
jgi:Tfp pilus assembly protein PilO